MDSGKLMLDTLIKTVHAPIMKMKAEIETALAAGEQSDGSGRTGPAGYMLESDNVSLEVKLRTKAINTLTLSCPEYSA